MLKEERRRRIMELLFDSKCLKSSELSEIFNVSQETIRKDLEYLDESGLLKRTFGGALSVSADYNSNSLDIIDPSLEDRTVAKQMEKDDIARFAATLIEPKDTIVLDSSTTTLQLVKYLPEDQDIVVITNALVTLNELVRKKGITVISLGGYYRVKSTSFLGLMSLSNLENFNINKAFMSGNAFSVEKGLMDPNEQEAEIKRKMSAMSQESILLIDSSKFTRMAPITTSPIKVFSTIITNKELPGTEALKIENMGLKVYRI